MKRGAYLLIILLVFTAINLVSAVNIELSKNSYQPSETLQAEITGNFINTLTKQNILIYEEGVPRSQPAISDLIRKENTYYFYAVLPNNEANFSLRIEGAEYTESGQTKTDTIIEEFKIKRTNESSLQINPGFINTDKDFSLKVKSLFENQEVSASFRNQQESFSLVEDNEKTIVFSIININSGKYDLTINDYIIPVFITKDIIPEPINNSTNQTTNQTNNQKNQTIPGTNVTIPGNITNLTDNEIDDYIEDLKETDTESLACIDIGGVKCNPNEECSGEEIASSNGDCCIGICNEKKESSYGWIFGVLLILIVLGVLVFYYLKSKGRLKPKSGKEILKGKDDKFNLRMENKLDKEPSKEVRGNLGKI